MSDQTKIEQSGNWLSKYFKAIAKDAKRFGAAKFLVMLVIATLLAVLVQEMLGRVLAALFFLLLIYHNIKSGHRLTRSEVLPTQTEEAASHRFPTKKINSDNPIYEDRKFWREVEQQQKDRED